MIDAQWSKTVLNLKTSVPLTAHVSAGKPGDISTNTLINPRARNLHANAEQQLHGLLFVCDHRSAEEHHCDGV
jgi:hypothetical protein